MRTAFVQCLARFLSLLSLFLIFAALPSLAQSFKNPPVLPTVVDPRAVMTADLNHDGNLDLVYVDAGQGLHILLGNGKGSFSHQQDFVLPAGICCAVEIADVNSDGNPDLVMQGYQGSITSQIAAIAVFLGNGDGTFQAPLISKFQTETQGNNDSFAGLAVGDINGDGHPDIVATDGTLLCILLGDGSGNFTLSSTIRSFLNGNIYLLT